MAHNWTPPVACALSKSLLLHTDSRPHGWADRLISMLSAWLKPQESVWVWSRSPSGSYSAFATRHSPYRLVRQPAFGCDLGLSHDCTDAVNPPVTIYLCTHCVKQRRTILEHRLENSPTLSYVQVLDRSGGAQKELRPSEAASQMFVRQHSTISL
jgi:hypothetical protein